MKASDVDRVSPSIDGIRSVAVTLFGLAAGAAALALLGPLVFDVIRHHASESAINQIAGGDLAALTLVAPIAAFAGILVWRGHRAGPVMALGPAVYGLYTYAQLTLGGDYVRYDGNSERFFMLYVALFVASAYVAVRSWTMIDATRLPGSTRRLDLGLTSLFYAVAGFLALGLHLPGLLDAWRAEPTSTAYANDTGIFWVVKLMDLAIVVPALVTVATGIRRRAPWAHKMMYGAVGWFALLASAVAGMAIVMQATDDPSASVANTVAFGAFAAIGLTIGIAVMKPLLQSATERGSLGGRDGAPAGEEQAEQPSDLDVPVAAV